MCFGLGFGILGFFGWCFGVFVLLMGGELFCLFDFLKKKERFDIFELGVWFFCWLLCLVLGRVFFVV